MATYDNRALNHSSSYPTSSTLHASSNVRHSSNEYLPQSHSRQDTGYQQHTGHNDYGHGDGTVAGGVANGGRLSRAPSRASARSGKSGRASSLSKSQSLIKKNIELQDLKPADILIERFMSWKAIVKQLCMYFEGIADIENNTAKEMMKLSGLIQVPFRSGNQFLGEGGLQDVYYSIRDKSKTIADQHANLGRTIDSSIVQHLQKLLVEIKAHIRNVQNDTGKLASSVAHERTTSTRLVGDLANSISLSKNTPLSLPARSDPYIANTLVRHQLGRQVLEENLLQKSLVIMQQNSAHFEEGIVRSIKSAWATFEEWRSRTQGVTSEMWSIPETLMASIESDREWIAFAARSDHLLDPETPLRDPELINYPLKDDPSTQALHTGFMSMMRRGGVVKSLGKKEWKESWYVLTPSGYLHEFASSDTSTPTGQIPTFSLFLPHCTLGPATPANAAVHGFHIEAVPSSSNGMGSSGSTASLGGGSYGEGLGRSRSASVKGGLKALLAPLGKKESSGALGMGGNGLGGGGGSGKVKSYTFRARSHEEKMEWWNDLRMLCARYLVASEVVRRSGPVERTVRGVGYAEEDLYDSEEELEEEELYNDAEVYHNPAAQRYTQEGQGVVYRGTEGGEYEGGGQAQAYRGGHLDGGHDASNAHAGGGHYQGLHSDGYRQPQGYTLHDQGPQTQGYDQGQAKDYADHDEPKNYTHDQGQLKSYEHHEQGGYYAGGDETSGRRYDAVDGGDVVVDLGGKEGYATFNDAPVQGQRSRVRDAGRAESVHRDGLGSSSATAARPGPDVDVGGGAENEDLVVVEQKKRDGPVVVEEDVKVAAYAEDVDSDATIDGRVGAAAAGVGEGSKRRLSSASGGAPAPVGTYSVNDMNEVVGSVGKASGSKKKKSKKGKGKKSAAGVFVEDID